MSAIVLVSALAVLAAGEFCDGATPVAESGEVCSHGVPVPARSEPAGGSPGAARHRADREGLGSTRRSRS
ncbi:hypothetical protein DIPPA_06916 [Diplonema papillatum]|nr:hypothetical protein DIPPA_06916 [Diplonema papillatum]